MPKFVLWIRADIADEEESSRKWNETASEDQQRKKRRSGWSIDSEHESLVYSSVQSACPKQQRKWSGETGLKLMDHSWKIPNTR